MLGGSGRATKGSGRATKGGIRAVEGQRKALSTWGRNAAVSTQKVMGTQAQWAMKRFFRPHQVHWREHVRHEPVV